MVKGKAESRDDAVSEIVKWVKEAKEPGETWADSEGEGGVPDEEADDTSASGASLFPGNARMKKISNKDGESGGDEIRKPEKVATFD